MSVFEQLTRSVLLALIRDPYGAVLTVGYFFVAVGLGMFVVGKSYELLVSYITE